MKKLLVAVILAVVLTMTLATPAFAGPPEDKPGNMPGKAADLGMWQGLWNGMGRTYGWGVEMSGGNAAYASVRAIWVIVDYLIQGQPPEPPWWSSAP